MDVRRMVGTVVGGITSGKTRRSAGVFVALGALAGMGVLSVMAAPGSGTPAQNANTHALLAGNGNTSAHQPQGPVVAGNVRVATPALPTATATTQPPAPTATDTPPPAPQPTATPVPPAPTPTATPTPSWHVVGNYSGSASQALVTLDSSYQGDPVRVDWTCTPTQALPVYPLGFVGPTTGGGTNCSAAQTSGTMNMGTDSSTSYPLTLQDSQDGAWTASVSVYY